MEQLATESLQAGTQQAVTAVRAGLWGAMSLLQPRLTAQVLCSYLLTSYHLLLGAARCLLTSYLPLATY